jgi:hypothetical protein
MCEYQTFETESRKKYLYLSNTDIRVFNLRNSHITAFPLTSNTNYPVCQKDNGMFKLSTKYLCPPLPLSAHDEKGHGTMMDFFLNTKIYEQFSLKKDLISEGISSTLWCTVTKWLQLHIISTENKLL